MCKTLSKETLAKKIKDVVGIQTQEGKKNGMKKFIFKKSQERKPSLLNTQKIKPSLIIGSNTMLMKKQKGDANEMVHIRHSSQTNEAFKLAIF